jgi:hypothetical protein
VASPDVPDDRPIQINVPDAEDEDESLLHSLDTPLDSLPRISTDELLEKRKLAITQMQADRTAMRAPTDPDPAAHDRGRPVLRLVHSVTAPHIGEPPSRKPATIIKKEARLPAPAAPERRQMEAVRQVMPASLSPATTAAATEQQPKPPPSLQAPPQRSRKPSKTTIPLDEKDQAPCLGIQDKELRFLVRPYKAGRQERGEPFVSQADMIQQWGISRDILYETDEIGRRIGFTPEKDEFIGHNALGRRATMHKHKGQFVTIPPEQFLKRITPGSETPAQTKARRTESKRPHRSKRRHEIRAEERAITKAQRDQAGDVDCRQSAVSLVVTAKWKTISQLGKDLAQFPAFRDRDGKQLVGRSLHRAILRTLRLAPLCDAIETQTRVGKFGNSILYVRRRP